jgi:hypothetical protein
MVQIAVDTDETVRRLPLTAGFAFMVPNERINQVFQHAISQPENRASNVLGNSRVTLYNSVDDRCSYLAKIAEVDFHDR